MTAATAQAFANIAFIKYSDEMHGRIDGKDCFGGKDYLPIDVILPIQSPEIALYYPPYPVYS